ncbi:MAG TPA: DUF444 family protein [Janthinobacterium sp.]|nr:DUF444 family protein [Janthinobacterium sp.]
MQNGWYELFSRGARDWLRHNEKVRDAVQAHLPELIAGPDLITGPQERTVQVPVRLLEHARFRLADMHSTTGAGQGEGKAGDLLRPGHAGPGGNGGTDDSGGDQDGELRLMLEFPIDDIMEWLWEEMKLPLLKPQRDVLIEEREAVREGWDKRGARSRLDRRRTVKEAIKRRALQRDAVAFTNDDLRFRQLVMRPKPSSNAVVFFVVDVSASMTQAERKLAKSFFFFALQGLRRQYARVETRFIGHTTRAWEFPESEFFQVTGMGGTIASSAFRLTLELARARQAGGQYNAYMFYASDGENFTEDRGAASLALTELAKLLNYIGYIETAPGMPRSLDTEMQRLCKELERRGMPVATSILNSGEDVWRALRKFFVHQSAQDARP